MKTLSVLAMTALGITTAISSADTVNIQNFALSNHPSGGINPQEYGLRLDGFGGESPVTFSFENLATGESTTRLTVIEHSDGSTDIRIHGVVWGNSANGGTNFGSFMLDVMYSAPTVTESSQGWEAQNAGEFIGSLTAMSGVAESMFGVGFQQDLFTLADSQGGSFRFLSDGHRIGNDSESWVGRGWVTNESDGIRGSTNDFLFTANVVPLPTGAMTGLVGLGLVGGMHWRRRHS